MCEGSAVRMSFVCSKCMVSGREGRVVEVGGPGLGHMVECIIQIRQRQMLRNIPQSSLVYDRDWCITGIAHLSWTDCPSLV